MLDAVGSQLVGDSYSAAAFDDVEQAILPIERALREQSTLLVVDNMESILLPPCLETPEALSEEAGRELKAILALCERLLKVGDTRLVFTSREALPAPFDAPRHRRELHRLDREDAVKLVERALNADHATPNPIASPHSHSSHPSHAALDAARESIEALVEAVHGHARTLALLAPELRSRGVEATREALVELMAAMEQQFPGSREHSLFASVELSLRRMSPANRDRARVLGVFHGGVDVDVLRMMMEWEEEDVGALAVELVATGLATPNRYNHLTLNPALCPYLRGRMDVAEREALTARWVEAMSAHAGFLHQQQFQDTELAATLTVLELPNLFAMLDLVHGAGDSEATIDLATFLYHLLQHAGKPRLLERVGQLRDAAAAALGDAWNHARFEAARTRIEQQLGGGRLREAFEGAQQLLQRAQAAGDQAYPGADCDLAMVCFLHARVLRLAGGSEEALRLLDEARYRFEAIEKQRPDRGMARMATLCFEERGGCLLQLGRFDEAVTAYEECIYTAERLGDYREAAVGKAQLGIVRMKQRRHTDALAAFAEARERFTQLNEPSSVALAWHQSGIVYQEAGQAEAADDAYRKALAISVRLGDVEGQARTLMHLGVLYGQDRPEDAPALFRQSADKCLEMHDLMHEGFVRGNLATVLHKLRRLDEARHEIRRAIECKAQFSHAAEPWIDWATLAYIETDAGNPAAAAEAKGKAIACYLAYRRDGGENHDAPGRIALAVTQSLLAGAPAQAASLLQQLAARPDAAWLLPFIRALQTIVAGRRDRSLADAPDLTYDMAAEIHFLIETLEKPR